MIISNQLHFVRNIYIKMSTQSANLQKPLSYLDLSSKKCFTQHKDNSKFIWIQKFPFNNIANSDEKIIHTFVHMQLFKQGAVEQEEQEENEE